MYVYLYQNIGYIEKDYWILKGEYGFKFYIYGSLNLL